MIKISVIMPVYNKEMYLDKTIQCILNQSYTNFELIIINDGSKDNSEKICKRYADLDSRVSVYTIENGGVSNARNTGIKYATGEYIQFIDGDDCINSDVFEKYISILNQKTYDIVFTDYNKVNHENKILKTVSLGYIGEKNKSDIVKDFLENQINTGFYGWISNKLIKKSIIEENNIKFDTKIALAEDLDFYLDVYRYSSQYYFLNIKSFNYLQEAQNSSMGLYDNLDYYIQLLINLKMKYFIKDMGYYSEKNKTIIDQRIIDYIYYIAFYSKLDKDIIKTKIDRVYNNKEIMDNLFLNSKLSFKNIIVRLITHNNYKVVYNLLCIREAIRKIIRGVINGGR